MVREGHSVSNRAKIEAAPEKYFGTHGGTVPGTVATGSTSDRSLPLPAPLPNIRRRFFENVGQVEKQNIASLPSHIFEEAPSFEMTMSEREAIF